MPTDNGSSEHSYAANIEYDVEGTTPREAAEQALDYILDSEGPIVELFDGTTRFHVDLAREPGHDDVIVVEPAPDPLSPPMSFTVLIDRDQAARWAGRPLSDEDLERLAKALPGSTVPEAIGDIVASFITSGPDDEQSDSTPVM